MQTNGDLSNMVEYKVSIQKSMLFHTLAIHNWELHLKIIPFAISYT